MEYLESIFLGMVQGLTEFLPVSSSGHLVLLQQLFGGFDSANLFEDIMLHIGTLIAVVIFTRHEVFMLFRALTHFYRPSVDEKEKQEKRLFFAILIAGIPTAVFGFLIKATLVSCFSSRLLLALTFAITTFLLIFSKFAKGSTEKLEPLTGLAVGTAQGLSVLPGISRSGSTIVIGQLMGLKRRQAARFAFVLSIPAIIGAALFTILDMIKHPEASQHLSLPLVCGMIASAIVGYISLVLLTKMIDNAKLHYFAFYTGLVSLFCLLTGLGWLAL